MPNWAFNYALALKNVDDTLEDDSTLHDRVTTERQFSADESLRRALCRFPSILSLLLEKNNVDTKGRAFHMDWSPVVAYFRSANVSKLPNSEAVEHIIRIFITRSHKLWSKEDVLKWLYECAVQVMTDDELQCHMDDATRNDEAPAGFSPALERYRMCDPEDYEDSFKRLPADANPLDDALVAPALAMDPNRRNVRFRGNNDRRLHAEALDDQDLQQMLLAQFGGGQQMVIDPADPIVAVFLQSLLPWARVDGV